MSPLEQVAEAIAQHGRPNWVAHVPQPIRVQVSISDLSVLLASARWSTDALTKADQYSTILSWCSENIFAEVTIDRLVEVSGLSSVSVRNFIKDKPHLFRKLRRGVWEVRDPQADREADQR
jgi:hypothetical protein